MSAELLRRAAAKMRENAQEASNDGYPWIARQHFSRRNCHTVQTRSQVYLAHYVSTGNAEHIASWHPLVALAVAAAMDDVAQAWEIADGSALDPDGDPIRFEDTLDGGWLAVAQAYLSCWCGGDVGPRVPGDADGLGCLEDVRHVWSGKAGAR